ncbi:MAG: hypothetical protein N2Z79_03515, partial [Candidatus Omnitrophica bacterium]|nr:hypothetical protein [Candidatus Omnitrophota bacterium]
MKELKIYKFIESIMKEKKQILRITVFSFLCGAIVSNLLPKIYKAESIIYVYLPSASTEFSPVGISVGIGSNNIAESNSSVFKGYMFINQQQIEIINFAQKLAKTPEILKYLKERFRLKNISLEKLEKEILKESILKIPTAFDVFTYAPVVFLRVEYKDRNLVEQLCNAWAEVLVNKINDTSSYRISRDYDFILKELNDCKGEIIEKENELNKVKAGTDSSFSKEQLEIEIKRLKENYGLLQKKEAQFRISK